MLNRKTCTNRTSSRPPILPGATEDLRIQVMAELVRLRLQATHGDFEPKKTLQGAYLLAPAGEVEGGILKQRLAWPGASDYASATSTHH